MTDLLELALDDLVPNFADEQPDWAGVVARSERERHRSRRPPWRRHPRRTAALAFALLLVALLATPAFGVQQYVLHLLGRKNVSFSASPSAPNVVKKQFLDLPLGAPKQFAPDVNAAEARVVATFSIGGRPRKLWVAPTRTGGYCYTFELSIGGCRQARADRKVGEKGQFGVSWMGGSPRRRVNATIVTRIAGDLTAPAAAKITASYADGTTADIPFVWVSAPISAGFFSYDIPTSHWTKQHRLLAVALSAKGGRELDRQAFSYNPRPPLPHNPGRLRGVKPQPRVLPATASPAPSAPTVTRTADGFRVVVGHNGSVQFTRIATTPILSELAGGNVSFDCFRLTKEFGIFTVRGFGQWGRLAARVGFPLDGVGQPVDGCEVEASIGRRWPDRLHNRAAAEIPLTDAGRRFFANRATARDLALFVRSRRMHTLRAEPAKEARADIVHTYGSALADSGIRIDVVSTDTLRFSERSTTNRTYFVTVRRGRIAKQNLKPYAFVF